MGYANHTATEEMQSRTDQRYKITIGTTVLLKRVDRTLWGPTVGFGLSPACRARQISVPGHWASPPSIYGKVRK